MNGSATQSTSDCHRDGCASLPASGAASNSSSATAARSCSASEPVSSNSSSASPSSSLFGSVNGGSSVLLPSISGAGFSPQFCPSNTLALTSDCASSLLCSPSNAHFPAAPSSPASSADAREHRTW